MNETKLEFSRRLADDWRDLATVLDVPEHVRRRFVWGGEPEALWDWLSNQRRLHELPAALRRIGRVDLANMVAATLAASRPLYPALTGPPPGPPLPPGPRPPPLPARRIRWLVAVAILVVAGLGLAAATALPLGWSFLRANVTGFGSDPVEPTPEVARQIVVQASGTAPWTVDGYGYRFSVSTFTHTTCPFGPNEGRPCLRIGATVERHGADDHTSMRLVVMDDRDRILGGDGASGSLEPPLNVTAQYVTTAVLQSGGAATLTFILRSYFWPDGKDLILADVPVPR